MSRAKNRHGVVIYVFRLATCPLCFKEFLDFCGVQAGELESEFALFMRYGALPGIHNLDLEDEPVFKSISAIYNTVLLKDVIARNEVRNVRLFQIITQNMFCLWISIGEKV